jgi:hypothetical protein
MGKEEKDSVADEAKSVAGNIIESLGLIEIIIGASALYWGWLWYGTPITTLLPSTGLQFVDVVLLAFGASLFGKIITFFSLMIMGLLRATVIRLFPYRNWLQDFCLKELKVKKSNWIDYTDIAMTAVVAKFPNQRKDFERIREKAVLAYSISILAFPYWRYFMQEDAPTLVVWLTGLGAFLFFVIGVFEQIDFVKAISERTLTLNIKQNQDDHSSEP